MTCERCGAETKGWALFDYCAHCSMNLCPDCMKKGCCGIIPAASGNLEDDVKPAEETA